MTGCMAFGGQRYMIPRVTGREAGVYTSRFMTIRVDSTARREKIYCVFSITLFIFSILCTISTPTKHQHTVNKIHISNGSQLHVPPIWPLEVGLAAASFVLLGPEPPCHASP